MFSPFSVSNCFKKKLSHFDSRFLARGKRIYQSNNIEILSKNDNNISLVVEGETGNYFVHVFKRDDGGIDVCCACPCFAKWQECKHSVAALHFLDQNFHHQDNPNNPEEIKKQNHSYARQIEKFYDPLWKSPIIDGDLRDFIRFIKSMNFSEPSSLLEEYHQYYQYQRHQYYLGQMRSWKPLLDFF